MSDLPALLCILRNQLRPITKLAEAAAAFGKGHNLRYKPRGALEVRAAGKAAGILAVTVTGDGATWWPRTTAPSWVDTAVPAP